MEHETINIFVNNTVYVITISSIILDLIYNIVKKNINSKITIDKQKSVNIKVPNKEIELVLENNNENIKRILNHLDSIKKISCVEDIKSLLDEYLSKEKSFYFLKNLIYINRRIDKNNNYIENNELKKSILEIFEDLINIKCKSLEKDGYSIDEIKTKLYEEYKISEHEIITDMKTYYAYNQASINRALEKIRKK